MRQKGVEQAMETKSERERVISCTHGQGHVNNLRHCPCPFDPIQPQLINVAHTHPEDMQQLCTCGKSESGNANYSAAATADANGKCIKLSV